MTFNCPYCNQPMEIGDEWAGHATACPTCQATVQVPVPAAPPPAAARPGIVFPPRPRGTAAGSSAAAMKAPRKTGGKLFGKLGLFAVLLAGASFGYTMIHHHETPQQTWERITRRWLAQPPPGAPEQPPSSTPSPTPNPDSDLDEDTPAVAVTTPALTPTPTPEITTPTPTATPDPLAWVMEKKERQPREITLLEATKVTVVYDGRVAGWTMAPAGSKLRVLSIEPGIVNADFNGAAQRIAVNATDLRQQAEHELARAEQATDTGVQPQRPAVAPFAASAAQGTAAPMPANSSPARFVADTDQTAAGPGVTLQEAGQNVVLSNGIVTATVTKGASISSLKYRGFEMGDTYYSMDGGTNYRTPGGGEYFVKTRTPDLVDIGFKHKRPDEPQALDCEIHYALQRGVSGVYTYAILSHPASYRQTGYGEWRAVWKLSNDLLEKIYVDALRHWQMPSREDYQQAKPTGIKEIIQLTTGPWAGKYDCKYDYNASYYDLGCWGHASDKNKVGAWIVVGGYDFFNDGPTKQDLNAASGINHIHFGMNHYGGSNLHVEAGQEWQKIYGPFLLYCNHSESGGDGCWADAKKRVDTEKAAWPYRWLTDTPAYPPANARGSLVGHLVIKDKLKPTLNAADAWVGLAQPPPGGNWQFESNHYQYWTKADTAGNFTVPNVRPGTYTFYVFTNGAVGEYSRANVVVKPGVNKLPEDVVWEIPHKGRSIAWEIGVPDRSAKEFRHGTDYFHGYVWTHFQEEFKNPLEYVVGKSDWSKDWNYAQSWYQEGADKRVPWKWRIHFDLPSVPAGEATMTFAIASAHGGARINVYVNNDSTSFKTVTPSEQGGNALLRESIHAKYCVDYLAIPTTLLKSGPNTITLEQSRTDTQTHVMYDYLNLELP